MSYEEGGQLTEAVRRRPYSLILLDEIEKAHADTFNVLVQVLDDGRLTAGQGRTVDFKNAVVIMTSNLGSRWFFEETLSPEDRRERVLVQMREAFRPEFLNRVDDVIVFDPLDKQQIAEIVDIQVRRFAERLAERRLTLELTDDARSFLAERGWDPALGARPLKRLIQKEIQDRLALALLEGQITDGDHVVVDRSGDALSVGAAAPV